MSEFNNFFISGQLCLDFCNTFDHMQTPPEYDFFPDRAVVLRWGQAAGILSAGSKDLPLAEERSLKKLLQTRALIFKLLFPFTCSTLPSRTDLDLFNTLLQEKTAKTKIVLDGSGFSLIFSTDDALEQIEYEVMHSTSNLLLSITPGRLKQCEGCGWLFYDMSRTHARRWCTMQLCGNRAKARRHYERSRQK